jgi:hypothetical protein
MVFTTFFAAAFAFASVAFATAEPAFAVPFAAACFFLLAFPAPAGGDASGDLCGGVLEPTVFPAITLLLSVFFFLLCASPSPGKSAGPFEFVTFLGPAAVFFLATLPLVPAFRLAALVTGSFA